MIDLTPGWQVALEAVGWAGSAVVVWSMMQQRILRLRLYNLVGCLVQILYNGVLGVWPVVTLNVVFAAIQVVNLRRLLRGRDDPTSYAVAEVPADGPLVAHLLGEHRQDVVRFQPGFERPSRDAEAYLVLSGDEVIGCVVVHDAGDGGRRSSSTTSPRSTATSPRASSYSTAAGSWPPAGTGPWRRPRTRSTPTTGRSASSGGGTATSWSWAPPRGQPPGTMRSSSSSSRAASSALRGARASCSSRARSGRRVSCTARPRSDRWTTTRRRSAASTLR